LDEINSLSQKRPFKISVQDILSIHARILAGIDDDNAGRYRTVAVRISGSAVVLANPRKVPDLMADFVAWLNESADLHPVYVASEAHYRLLTIHPFVDRNGRTARLLMNCILMAHEYPAAIIRKRDRLAYIGALEAAQLGGSKDAYENLILQSVDRSLDIYLEALNGRTSMKNLDSDLLLKIGELAKKTGESIATLRHWVKEGLLEPQSATESGYMLFNSNMIDRCRQIQYLKKQRFLLSEIRSKLSA
jgi:Fic family protein